MLSGSKRGYRSGFQPIPTGCRTPQRGERSPDELAAGSAACKMNWRPVPTEDRRSSRSGDQTRPYFDISELAPSAGGRGALLRAQQPSRPAAGPEQGGQCCRQGRHRDQWLECQWAARRQRPIQRRLALPRCRRSSRQLRQQSGRGHVSVIRCSLFGIIRVMNGPGIDATGPAGCSVEPYGYANRARPIDRRWSDP
jgi:hypothetical protein